MEIIKKWFKGKEKKSIVNLAVTFFIGILLIVMGKTLFQPNQSQKAVKTQEPTQNSSAIKELAYEESLEKRLEDAYGKVSGVGNVSVVVTIKSGKEISLAKDTSTDTSSTTEKEQSGGTREIKTSKNEYKTIILSGKDGYDQPLILKESEPQIEGVLIIAEGGEDVFVKQALIHSTEALLNVEPHKIQVLKMK